MRQPASIPLLRTDRILVLLLGVVTAIDAMSIDVYLPAAPLMRADLGTSDVRVQQAMAVFFAGIILGQLTWGPLSDQFGRRRPLLTGLVLFCVGCLLALLAPDVGALIVGRFLQSVGASAGVVVARAIVHDMFDGVQAPKIYSLLMQILGVTAVVSPLVGGAILLSGQWRPIFAFLVGVGMMCTLACLFRLPESLPTMRGSPTNARLFLSSYRALLASRAYLCAVLASAFSMACMFGLLTGSAFYFVQQARWSSAAYALLYAFTSLIFIITCQINILALKSVSPARLCLRALIAQLVVAAVLAGMGVTGTAGPTSVAIAMTVLIAIVGFIFSNATACVMSVAKGNAGAASGLLGVLQFGASALVAPLVTASTDIERSISLTLAACAALALLAWLAAGDLIPSGSGE
jgi:MFS transporter, DHA1 family, multidrug resistance protein